MASLREPAGQVPAIWVWWGHTQSNRSKMSNEDALRRKIATLEEEIRHLSSSQLRLHSVLEHLSNVVWETDQEGRFTYLSSGIKETLGYAPEELLGEPPLGLVEEKERERVRELLWRLGAQRKPFRDIRFWGYKQDQKTRVYQSINAAPIMGEEGEFLGYVGITRDETQQLLAEFAIKEIEQRNQLLLQALPDMLFVLDAQGVFHDFIVDENCQLLLPKEKVIGSRIHDLGIEPHYIETILSCIRGVLENGEENTVDFPLQDQEGEHIHELRFVRLSSERVMALQREVTQERTLQRALRVARDDAEKASRTKSRFLRNISHELRNPMAGIMGMTQLALSTDLTQEQQYYLTMVLSSAESFLASLNNIIDFAGMETGSLSLHRSPFHFRETLAELLTPLALAAHKKSLALHLLVEPSLPTVVVTDQERLCQVLTNLVGNAVQFSTEGEILVRVQGEQLHTNTLLLHFSIEDSGVGIPLEKIQEIFSPYSQVDNSSTWEKPGTGLGLPIARSLVRLLGGDLQVESHEGVGSTLSFSIPCCLGAPSRQDHSTQFQRTRVLIVDQRANSLLALEKLFTHLRLSHTSTNKSQEALDLLLNAERQGTPYTAVLLNTTLSTPSAFSLAQKIRETPPLEETKLLFMSSQGSPQEHQEAARFGPILSEPLRPSKLLNSLTKRTPPQGAAPQGQFAFSRPLTIYVAEDNPVNQKLCKILLEKMGHQVVVAANGVDLLDALNRGWPDAIFMDIQMPILDGFQTTVEVRRREALLGLHTPIIGLTANAMAGDRERCFAHGIDYYLAKPFRLESIKHLLEEV
ncbi:MAG: hypothetical protein CSA75_03365, partial [Sorangium cellulosum]